MKTIKCTVLKSIVNEGYYGVVISGTLLRSGPGIVPQIFPRKLTREWLKTIARHYNPPFVNGIDDFVIVNATLTIEEDEDIKHTD